MKVPKGFKAVKVYRVYKELQELVLKEHKELLRQGLRARKERLAHRVLLTAHKEPRVQQAVKVIKVVKECKALQGQARKAPRALQHQVIKVLKEYRVRLDQAHKELKALLHQVIKVPKEYKVVPVLVIKARKEYKV